MPGEALNPNKEALSHSEELHEQLKQINYNLEHTSAEYLKAEFDDNEPFVMLKDFVEIKPNFFVGTRFDLWLLSFNAEVAFSYDFANSEYINTTYSLRANMSF